MNLAGACHCRDIHYELEWPQEGAVIPARRCTCSYCMRFNGTWTSHPEARLVIRLRHAAGHGGYRFGTATADFLFCGRCGITIAALCETDGTLRAVVNVNTLDRDDIVFEHSDSNFDSESKEQRLNRRQARWIAHVQIIEEAQS